MQHDFILLDRSGSMETLWTEALSSINSYVKRLADEGVDTGVTLATFDSDGESLTSLSSGIVSFLRRGSRLRALTQHREE